MFDDKTMTIPEMRDFINAHEWNFAKSMPFIPHWYVVLKNCRDWDEFFSACQLIRDFGAPRKFGKRTFIYFDLDGYSYWTMDELIEDTTIINRARIK